MNEEIRDVSPDPETDLTQPAPSGQSQSTIPDKPKPKSWIDKVKDAFKSDPGIEEMRLEKERIRRETEQKCAELDTNIARKESELATTIRERDPAVIAERKRVEALLKARHAEARRLASLNAMISEYERRHPVKDESLISFYESQIDRENLWGVFGKTTEE